MVISARKNLPGVGMQTPSLPLGNPAYGCSFAFSSQSTELNSASGYIHVACVSKGGIEFSRELGLKGK